MQLRSSSPLAVNTSGIDRFHKRDIKGIRSHVNARTTRNEQENEEQEGNEVHPERFVNKEEGNDGTEEAARGDEKFIVSRLLVNYRTEIF